MKINNIIYIVFILICCQAVYSQQVQWPFENPDLQGIVTGSLGEYRGSTANPRFHRGNDLANADRSIHSINLGEIEFYVQNSGNARKDARDTWISVGGVLYYHVMPDSAIITNEITMINTIGTYLGEMMVAENWGTHVHLQESNTNYLNNTLQPFYDNHEPEFVDTYLSRNNGIELYRNGILSDSRNYLNLRYNLTNQIDATRYWTVYNKVDIAAHIKDERIDTNGNGDDGEISPFKLKWEIYNSDSTRLAGDSILHTRPTQSNIQARYSFHPSSSTQIGAYRSINILTSDPYENDVFRMDQFWNSRLQFGRTENFELRVQQRDESLDAFINQQCQTKDGLYRLRIEGCDIDEQNPNNCVDRGMNLLIDNFKPYIRRFKIAISDTGESGSYVNIYTGEWLPHSEYFNGELVDRWIEFQTSGSPTISPSDYVEFRIFASEPLKWNLPSVEPTIEIDGVTTPPTLIQVNDSKEFVYIMTPGNFDLSGNDNGTKTITINGYDLANNQITGFDQLDSSLTDDELPYRIGETQWSGTLVSKIDTRHILNVGGNSCAPPGERVANNTCPLVADFDHQPDFSNPQTILFTDKSVPSDEITSWHWDFGDGFTSNDQNPTHSYQFVGEYLVSLTVSRGAEEDSWTQFIDVTSEPLTAEFNLTPSSGTAPLSVSLNSSSSQGNIQSWQWDVTPMTGVQYVFGNPSSENPTLRINTSGNYTVNLTVGNGISTHTSDSQIINVTPGNSGETIADFEWEGPVYAGAPAQFIDKSFIQCVGGVTNYTWNIYEATPIMGASNNQNPLLTIDEIGSVKVELVVDDGCGGVLAKKEYFVTVEDGAEANEGLTALFGPLGGTVTGNIEDGFEFVYNQGDTVEFLDRSTDRNKIKVWSWWTELPLNSVGSSGLTGENISYEQYQESIKHTYNNPGKYQVRLFVFNDIDYAGPYWDEIIVIRRPESFCSTEEKISDTRTFVDGDDETIAAGILEIYDPIAEAKFIVDSGAVVNLLSTKTNIKTDDGNWPPSKDRERIHFKSGSKVHIKSAACEELRVTFD